MDSISQLIIAFEGMDGVGKTTISKLLQTRLNSYINTSYSSIDSYGQLTKRESNDPSLSFGYYIDNLISKINVTDSEIIIFDRYILSAKGYLNLRANKDDFIEVYKTPESRVRPADITFILSANKITRKQRILNKLNIDVYDLNSLKVKDISFWEGFYMSSANNSTFYIDCDRDIKTILEEIYNIVSNYCKLPNKENALGQPKAELFVPRYAAFGCR